MRVLVVGGGGREHALAWKLVRSPRVETVVAAPGNAGIAEVAECVPVDAADVPAVVDLAGRRSIDLAVIGPEAPLAAGLADALGARGVAAFGPPRAGARIEGSKVWAKELCERYGIPTARARSFTDVGEASAALDRFGPPYVVKADGLAAGKGVTVAHAREEAERALRGALVEGAFGDAGRRVLLEEHLEGREVSMLALTDGRRVVPLVPAQDFKRALDGDAGPNTGGMGAYSPVPFLTDADAARIERDVLERAVRALHEEGIEYRGVLYAGVMVTDDGPKLLEFNARFGDPEAQAILPRLRSDLAELLLACARGDLARIGAAWAPEAAVTVVLASGGYPGRYRTGFEIRGLEAVKKIDKVEVFHAGTARRDGRVVTDGGRVLAVTATGADLADARRRAYEACAMVSFEGMHYRTDVGKEAAGG